MELDTQAAATAFRRLVEHLRARHDVQNIDLMNLAGFCRNCLADWYREAAAEGGIRLDSDILYQDLASRSHPIQHAGGGNTTPAVG